MIARVAVLFFCFTLSCQSKERTEATNESVPQQTPGSSTRPADPLDTRVRVPDGSFVFGATEKQFDFYARRSVVNFPGMIENLRKSFIIPPRSVKLPGYEIDQFEVTNQQFRNFLRATKYRPRDPTDYLKQWLDTTTYPDWAPSFPVVWVSQEDAAACCQWKGGRLPTEEEWEKAARGTDARYFPWGNVFPTSDTANFYTEKLEPAGNRPGDKSPYEVYDMGGNVAEITSTAIEQGGQKKIVVRGGSFRALARETLTYQRALLSPAPVRSDSIGFRCVFPK